MANNTNAQAIDFANRRARPLADLLYAAYLTAKDFMLQWNSQNIGAIIPDDANLIQDGATVASGIADGRQPAANGDINRLRDKCLALIAYFEGSTGTPANDSSLTNLNQATKIQVNGKAIF